MHPAFFSLLLTALHVSVLVDCRPRPWDSPEQRPDRRKSSSHTGTHTETPAGPGRFYLELSGSMRRGVHTDSLVVLPVRTDTSTVVSIFDLRRKRFLCMDLKGKLHVSRQKDKADCLFQPIWFDLRNHRDVFSTATGGKLLKLQGAAHREQTEASSVQLEMFLGPLVKRQRRSEEVNPSDPLRTHPLPPHSAKDHKETSHGQPEQDQAGAVSKETITSCDDPLRVLQHNGPVSPVKTNIADRAEQD
ncbi:fibroblast growth factor 23-like [Paralichthys olivaceus]|uniref:fibroblast growth factor 23-like n=1 Tax=Paralichthys olivaceus TaxID=8255 RepID=UPI00097DA33B|nr:PREDICTED: fibroblast growth factor 23-like [Paralichthys olivaceus]